jgi:hypothetical protein
MSSGLFKGVTRRKKPPRCARSVPKLPMRAHVAHARRDAFYLPRSLRHLTRDCHLDMRADDIAMTNENSDKAIYPVHGMFNVSICLVRSLNAA